MSSKNCCNSKMVTGLVLVIGFFSSLLSYQASGENFEAVEMMVNQNYSGARKVVDQILCSDPDDIEALYLSLAIEQTRILDYESYVIESNWFISFADSIRKRIEVQVPSLSGNDSLKGVFYTASVVGGIGVMQAKNGNWFDGAKNAYASVNLLKDILKIDPDFNAANLGIGLFNYYLGNTLSWVPFVGNRVEKGLGMIWMATQAPPPYNVAAMNSLCWIYIEKEEYGRADSLASVVLKKSPDNSIYLKIRALAALRSGQYNKAVPAALSLIDNARSRNPVNWSDYVTGYYILVKSFEETDNRTLAFEKSQEILSLPIPEKYKAIPHIERHLGYLSEIRERFGTSK